MRRIKNELDDHKVPTVWFNPWVEEGNDALEGLIRSVLGEIDGNILRKAMRNKRLIGLGRLVVGVIAGWLRIGNVVDELWGRLQVSVEARNQMTELMAEAMKSWQEKAPDPGGRLLVVFVDDLDRCSPENVLKVFEAVKLYLDVAGFVFVLGYDRNVISDSILRQKSYGPAVRASDYIEKIVQITYTLDRPSDDAAERLVEEYLTVAGVADLLAESERGLLSTRNARNPRRIKRFINNFVVEYQLDADWRELGAPLLIRALLLVMYYPEVVGRLGTGRGRDPLREAVDYARAVRILKRDEWRRALAGGDPEDAEPNEELAFLKDFFASYNLAFSPDAVGTTKELLDILREELPPVVVAAAGDDEFLSVAENLGELPDREALLAKLAGRARPAVDAAETGEDESRPSPAAGPVVFINYRHEDTAPFADRLADSLHRQLGSASVRRDLQLPGGTDWVEALRRDVESSDVVLVLIGPRWLQARNHKGELALGSSEDYLTSEVVTALEMRKLVIPVLLDGARFPPTHQLPPSLARLARRTAVTIRDEDWSGDVDRLVESIRRYREGPVPESPVEKGSRLK
jgi:hypothetical protein